MFIKRGDGKILSVVDPDAEMTEEQKKAARDLSKKKIKNADESDPSRKSEE